MLSPSGDPGRAEVTALQRGRYGRSAIGQGPDRDSLTMLRFGSKWPALMAASIGEQA